MDAGYPRAELPLGVETIICRQNIDELPEMWVWARERGIVPYFEMITFQGRAKRKLDLNVSSEELRRVFYELSRHRPRAVRARLGAPPADRRALLQPARVLLHAQRPGVHPALRRRRHVHRQHPPRAAGRDPRDRAGDGDDAHAARATSRGPAGRATRRSECYGCRGLAYHVTGDFLEADPLCWHNPRRII